MKNTAWIASSALTASSSLLYGMPLPRRLLIARDRLVDFVCGLPARYRMRGFHLKRLLKASLKVIVPDLVLTRLKRGFGTPMGTWLRTDLRPLVGDLLTEERLGRDGLFNVDFVNSLLRSHYAGREECSVSECASREDYCRISLRNDWMKVWNTLGRFLPR